MAVASTRSFPETFRTSIGQLSGSTLYIVGEIHGNPFGSLPMGVTGLALPSIWAVRVPRPRITGTQLSGVLGAEGAGQAMAGSLWHLLEQLPHLWWRRRALAGLWACGAVCYDPPLLCDLGEVPGAPWDRFLHAQGVASIYHSVLSCPEDLLPQEKEEPSTGRRPWLGTLLAQ